MNNFKVMYMTLPLNQLLINELFSHLCRIWGLLAETFAHSHDITYKDRMWLISRPRWPFSIKTDR